MDYKKTDFLHWYLETGSDQEQAETLKYLGKKAAEQLKKTGVFVLLIDDLYKEAKHLYNEEKKTTL